MRPLRSWLPVVGSLALAGVPAPTAAQPLGSEFQVNTYTTGSRQSASVAVDASGNFVVAWSGFGAGDAQGIFGQRYDSGGNALGTEFRVNSYTTGDQANPAVAADASGNFVVVWVSDHSPGPSEDILGQRYDSAGTAVGPQFRVGATISQQGPSVASDAIGNFVVVWDCLCDGDGWAVLGRRYDSAGVPHGGQFQVNTYTPSNQWHSAVASDASGNFVVAWEGKLPGSGTSTQVIAQRYDSEGASLGTEFRVNSPPAGSDTAVASDASGNFVVVWQLSGDVFGRRYDREGMALGAEFLVSSQTWINSDLSVASDATGNFVAVWERNPTLGSSERDIFGRRYDNAGEPVGVEFRVNSHTTGYQVAPAVGAAGNAPFVVVWNGSDHVLGQRFGFSGEIPAIHVGDLDGRAKDVGASWLAQVKTLVHDDDHRPLSGALLTVYVTRVGTHTCTTTAAGECEINVVVPDSRASAIVTVTHLTKAGVTYAPATNHDPETDSDGTVIVVDQP